MSPALPCLLSTWEALLGVSPGLRISGFHLCLRVFVVYLSFRSGQFQILLCQRRLVSTLTFTQFARAAFLPWQLSPGKRGSFSEPRPPARQHLTQSGRSAMASGAVLGGAPLPCWLWGCVQVGSPLRDHREGCPCKAGAVLAVNREPK